MIPVLPVAEAEVLPEMKMKKKSIRCLIGVLLLLGVIALAFVPKEHAKKDASDADIRMAQARLKRALVRSSVAKPM